MADARVAVVGAGLAGAATAAALARAGHNVDLIAEPCDPGASALPLGVLRPHLATQLDPLARVRRHGLRLTRAWLSELERHRLDCGRQVDGALAIAGDARSRARRDRLPSGGSDDRRVTRSQAQRLAGVDPADSAIFHPRGACIAPARLVAAFLQYAGGHVVWTNARIRSLQRRGSRWHLLGAPPLRHAYRHVVLATGAGTSALLPEIASWLEPARGQATAIGATAASTHQRLPVSGDGYITPAVDGLHWVGATLQRGATSRQRRSRDDETNIARFQRLWPTPTAPEVLDHFVGIRATTRDRLPVVGALAPGLWLSVGHGSHGLSTAPLAGLLLAGAIHGRAAPLLTLVSPHRPALQRARRRSG